MWPVPHGDLVGLHRAQVAVFLNFYFSAFSLLRILLVCFRTTRFLDLMLLGRRTLLSKWLVSETTNTCVQGQNWTSLVVWQSSQCVLISDQIASATCLLPMLNQTGFSESWSIVSYRKPKSDSKVSFLIVFYTIFEFTSPISFYNSKMIDGNHVQSCEIFCKKCINDYY